MRGTAASRARSWQRPSWCDPAPTHVCRVCRAYDRKKAAERKREEERIREREDRLLDRDATPETDDDFERLILSEPNSSYLWIKYIAFQLSLADIDAARSVRRAARTLIEAP